MDHHYGSKAIRSNENEFKIFYQFIDCSCGSVWNLGLPAVNEGLVLSNDLLNAFNSIPPTLDLDTSNATVLSVLQQAHAVLDLVDDLDGVEQFSAGFPNSEVVRGFLPDVMRIDLEVGFQANQAAYNGDAVVVTDHPLGINDQNDAFMLTGGRKLKDDVVDITLSYLAFKNPFADDQGNFTVGDNVSYRGENDVTQGHDRLFNEDQDGNAQFPFLANPY